MLATMSPNYGYERIKKHETLIASLALQDRELSPDFTDSELLAVRLRLYGLHPIFYAHFLLMAS